ncbi:hypothetical protein [Nonomuraea sp. NPDC023979]|uniref:hypothetical protein n=1 Tax=Nonomuraea sp. NPDC023979 TaxID=3154796 RepID=UPI0033C2B47E
MSEIVITTEPIRPGSSIGLTLCHDQFPVEFEVYANGRLFTLTCGGCVKDVPGYGGGLQPDDVIPNHWTVRNPGGTLRGFYGGRTAEDVRRAFDLDSDVDPARLSITPTTARVLFALPR